MMDNTTVRNTDCTLLADADLVGAYRQPESVLPQVQGEEGQPMPPRSSTRKGFCKQKPTGGIPFLARSLTGKGFNKGIISLIMDAWRPSTKKLYSTYLNKWGMFCVRNDVSLLRIDYCDAGPFRGALF